MEKKLRKVCTTLEKLRICGINLAYSTAYPSFLSTLNGMLTQFLGLMVYVRKTTVFFL